MAYGNGNGYFQEQYYPDPAVWETSASASVPALMGAAGSSVLRLAQQFPSLAGFLATMQARGLSMSPQKLWLLARRFGPSALVGMGLVAAEVLQDLFAWKAVGGGKRRRINVANSKALRRSLRRLDGFARLSQRVMTHRAAFRSPGFRKHKTCK